MSRSTEQPLYIQTNRVWSDRNIQVCFHDSDGNDWPAHVIRDAVTNGWQANTGLNFTYWGQCRSDLRNSIRIRYITSGNSSVLDIGTRIRDRDEGMDLNINYREELLRHATVHEFGHAIGLHHEQARPENHDGSRCNKFQNNWAYEQIFIMRNGQDQAVAHGSFDPWSIMSYCAPASASPTAADVGYVQQYYGARTARKIRWHNGVQRDTCYGAGAVLYPGQTWMSVNYQFRLVLQPDSNLVLYRVTVPLWASNTVGQNAAYAVFQEDGNFVLYDTNGVGIWHSNTWGNPQSRICLQNDGNLVIYRNRDGAALWHSGSWQADELFGACVIAPGRGLLPGEQCVTRTGNFVLSMDLDGYLRVKTSGGEVLWQSASGQPGWRLSMTIQGVPRLVDASGNPRAELPGSAPGGFLALREDAALVVYEPAKFEIWSALHTPSFQPSFEAGQPVLFSGQMLRRGDWRMANQMVLTLQEDGNLVLYNNNRPVWATGTNGTPADRLVMQEDGNLVLYDGAGKPYWASNTHGYRNTYLALVPGSGRLSIYRVVTSGLIETRGPTYQY